MRPELPYKSLADLPDGSVVGTSSVRRSAQLLRNYPKLQFKSVRGNINTRLAKLDSEDSEYTCLLLAAAGLNRVGLGHRITKCLDKDEMYHAVGQGALGVEIRKGDMKMKKVCAKIECQETTFKCYAERSLLRTLEGGCSVPVGCNTEYNRTTKVLTLDSIVLNPEGTEAIELTQSKKVECREDAIQLGHELALKMIENGAKKILDQINFDKINEIKQAGLTTSGNSSQSSTN
ncbi:unnamed protein product [Ambrosiozyma monospora]|uniref:Unnamed protein product n=1 Tax=Ambrosiozyma monospora TaxID=43982 RepID=A0ACB5U5V1_AMBMO|nr:unnamed protein product [Ambrosiozyma monospora]